MISCLSRKSLIVIVIMLILCLKIKAVSVSGIIRSKDSGEPLSFATVVLAGQNTGVQSNAKGYYILPISKTGEQEIRFSLISYKTKSVTVDFSDLLESKILNVELEKEAVQMEGRELKEARAKREFVANTPEIRAGNILSSAEQLLEVSQFGEGDIIRSIQALPGVSSVSDFSSGLYIWGGTYDQNLILLDDIDVYNPTHFGGIFSTFNTDAISTVELMKGGYPALYGGRMSSVLNINNREGNRKEYHGAARISLISAAATVEGPISRIKKNSSFMASFRRSYFDIIAKFIDDVPPYYFYDGHARVNWDYTPTNKFSLSFYNGRDDLTMDLGVKMHMSWGNSTFTLNNTRMWKNGIFGSFILAGSAFDSKLRIREEETTLYDWDNSIKDLTLKARFSKTFNEESRLDWGAEIKYMKTKFFIDSDLQFDPSNLYNIEGECLITSAYLQEYWNPSLFWNFEPGLRINHYKLLSAEPVSVPDQEALNISPRLSVRRIIDSSSNIYLALGRYYQYLIMVSGGVNSPMDVWFPLDGSIDPSWSDHYILGYKKEFGENFALDYDIYYKDFENLSEQDQNSLFDWDNNNATLDQALLRGDGFAWGTDVLLRTDWFGVSGFLGYSLGLSKRKMDSANLNPQNGEPQYFFPRYDRTHQVTLMENLQLYDLFNFKIGDGYPTLGINLTYKTGRPMRKPERIYFDGEHYEILYSYEDAVRLPAYFRIDLSFKWKTDTPIGEIEPYLELINITDHENVNSRSYEVELDDENNYIITSDDFTELPFVPMFGVSLKW